MNKRILFGLAGLLLICPGFLSAQGPLDERTDMRAKNLALKEMYKELSEDQQAAIGALRENFHNDAERLKIDLDIAKLELKRLLMNEEVTKTEIRRQLEVIAAITTDIKMAGYSLEIDIKKMMTDEQKQKYEQLRIMIAGKIEQELRERQKRRSGADDTKREPR